MDDPGGGEDEWHECGGGGGNWFALLRGLRWSLKRNNPQQPSPQPAGDVLFECRARKKRLPPVTFVDHQRRDSY